MKLSDDDAADVDKDDVPKLDSYLPYESVFGECIQNRHQVEVEVVEDEIIEAHLIILHLNAHYPLKNNDKKIYEDKKKLVVKIHVPNIENV